jgi:3-oxoacyl-[acyl-carrier protein] reductase
VDLGLDGKVALVTGAYRGTGAGIARVLAAEGAAVAVHRFEAGQSDAVVDQIVAAGGTAVGVDGDVLTEAGGAHVVDLVREALGPIAVLINNLGAPGNTTWETPADAWHDAWERNVLSGVRLAQKAVPAMREQRWGRLVFLGTIGTARPGQRNPDYYGAKAALPAIARSLAKELRDTGITVNVVSPGIIATTEIRESLTRRAVAAGVADTWADVMRWGLEQAMDNLTGRIPEPEDIGRVVAFVASDGGWHINGADLRVDGGALDA